MLEYWNDGILGFAKIGHVVIGKMSLDFGVYKIDKRKTFFQNQHSIIPPPHYSMYETETQTSKNTLYSR